MCQIPPKTGGRIPTPRSNPSLPSSTHEQSRSHLPGRVGGVPSLLVCPIHTKCPSHERMEMCTYQVRKAPGESHMMKLIGWGPCPRAGGGHRRCECGPWRETSLLDPCLVEAHSHSLISAQAPGAEETRAPSPHFTCRSPLTTLCERFWPASSSGYTWLYESENLYKDTYVYAYMYICTCACICRCKHVAVYVQHV